jgi:phage FluMu protein Com
MRPVIESLILSSRKIMMNPMTRYQPATPHSNSIRRPDCSKCGTAMLLFGIEAESPGRELLSFECPRCQNIETRTIKSEYAT